MMNKIKARLRGTAGESLAETLIATLIAALALVMLAGAIGSAARIINGSRAAITQYNSSEVATVKSAWETAISGALNTTD